MHTCIHQKYTDVFLKHVRVKQFIAFEKDFNLCSEVVAGISNPNASVIWKKAKDPIREVSKIYQCSCKH